ncbi:MAG: hypothetical protein HOM63_10095 [Kordiimonadaceae bacterium]|nr:hypothetical protein [Kordiimonadaceae bacterium]
MLKTRKFIIIFESLVQYSENGKYKNPDWYLYFFQLITENRTFDKLKHRLKSITLIIFNYDRCLEQFLIYSLILYYNIDKNEAVEAILNINIVHPYGQVGTLLNPSSNDFIEYGGNIDIQTLETISEAIYTFSETFGEDKKDLNLIHSKIIEADRIIFLGFAFHEMNMKLLTPPIDLTKKHFPEIYASAYGIEKAGQNIIRDNIFNIFKDRHYGVKEKEIIKENKINIHAAKCHEFFAYFLMGLKF